uniref:Uncharacterized protein n=1 Tax=Vitis vinifera TaxID=29760 RepID=F6H6D8_VITVI
MASHSVIPFFLSLISNWVSFHHFYFLPSLFFWLGLGLGFVFGFPGISLMPFSEVMIFPKSPMVRS